MVYFQINIHPRQTVWFYILRLAERLVSDHLPSIWPKFGLRSRFSANLFIRSEDCLNSRSAPILGRLSNFLITIYRWWINNKGESCSVSKSSAWWFWVTLSLWIMWSWSNKKKAVLLSKLLCGEYQSSSKRHLRLNIKYCVYSRSVSSVFGRRSNL